MDPLAVTSFHTVLFCREWEACTVFYRDVIGFPVLERRKGFLELQVTPESRIGLLWERRPQAAHEPAGRFLLSFRVPDVHETHKKLTSRGLDPAPVRQHPWGAEVLEARDPEGRRLEFWSSAP